MAVTCRSCWRNCALHADAEIIAIDQMEDQIAPISDQSIKIRQLISSLELCHHKAERWIHNIIEAIASGSTQKGLGTRPAGQFHPAEQVWQDACTSLAGWCAGNPVAQIEITVGNLPASELLAQLGERSALKLWQVQRVIDRIRSFIHWPQSLDDPDAHYQWLLLGGGDYQLDYLSQCPEVYREHEDFWLQTARSMLHDSESGQPAEISLAIAIDTLMPCHWNFIDNLQTVLAAIGGRLHAQQPFAACGRNITLVPIRRNMRIICNTLKFFYAEVGPADQVDQALLTSLGEATGVKQWLAASLDKTIRLQLNPPADLRAISALSGPEWVNYQS